MGGGAIPSSGYNGNNFCSCLMWNVCRILLDALMLSKLKCTSRVEGDCLEDVELISYSFYAH